MRAGLLLFALGMAPMASFSSSAPLLVALALLSLGYGLASPAIASFISRRTTRHQQGEVLGVNQSALSLARVFGPLAGGFVYQALGPAPAYVWGGLVAIVALALTRGIDRNA
jgi:predicted MFS family arabinose efflux permease